MTHLLILSYLVKCMTQKPGFWPDLWQWFSALMGAGFGQVLGINLAMECLALNTGLGQRTAGLMNTL